MKTHGENYTYLGTMDFKTAVQVQDSIIINEVTLPVVKECGQILKNPINWHKFLIKDVYGLNRNAVLKFFWEYVKPLDFIPLSYIEEGKGAFFFARLCGPVIEKLASDKLKMKNPLDRNKPFKIKIILKYTTTEEVKIDLSENTMKVLQKRLIKKTDTLCLNNYSEDPDLSEFFLLSQPKLLAFVLNIARNLAYNALKLCHNEIKTLEALRIIPPRSITSIDLRHNLINDLAELKHLENLSITDLWLEGNPLCELYDEYSYVQNVIKYCPKIEKLDGFLLRQNGVPSFRRNFLCNISSYEVIDQFLQRFFTSYDSKNFFALEGLYHKEALFSMTAEFFHQQLTASSASTHINIYKTHARNLLHLSGGISTNLYVGRREILSLFNKLPRSEHDPYSFTVDVLFYSLKCAIIVVTGVFREIPGIEKLLSFNRYFVLERYDNAYHITNEQLHISNALTSQLVTAFKKSNILEEAQTSTQKNQMISTFCIITNLTKDWAKMYCFFIKFLEECQYNMKHAMMLFVDLYESEKIPSQGFRLLE